MELVILKRETTCFYSHLWFHWKDGVTNTIEPGWLGVLLFCLITDRLMYSISLEKTKVWSWFEHCQWTLTSELPYLLCMISIALHHAFHPAYLCLAVPPNACLHVWWESCKLIIKTIILPCTSEPFSFPHLNLSLGGSRPARCQTASTIRTLIAIYHFNGGVT